MARDFSRLKRVGDQMQRELAMLIQQRIKDPRIGMVTVTAVEVSRELENARVYITTMGEAQDATETVQVLNRAAGFLRHELSGRLTIRVIPRLFFVYDTSIEYGTHLSKLIEAAVAADKKT